MRYVITGVSRGIGRELAARLAARGDEVIGTIRQASDVGELIAGGVRIELLDVADSESVQSFAGALGEQAIDVLINSAGIYDEREALGSVSDRAMRACFEVNTLGPLRVTQALLGNLRRARTRRVFHFTSRMGSIVDNTSGGSYAYRASKAALNMINKSLSIDLSGEGFTCCVLHPGWVATDMGGANAPTSVADSVSGLLALIDDTKRDLNGRFFDFSGEELPY